MASKDIIYNDTECPVCMETFKDPKQLPCTHTYCLQCIEKIVSRRKSFACPECQRDTAVPDRGPQALPDNRYIHSILRVTEQAKKLNQKKLQAEKLLEVKLRAEKLQGKEDTGHQSEPICTTHKQPLLLYCDDCQQLICAICLIKHKRHEIVDVAEKYVEVKGHIKKVINEAKNISAKYKDYFNKLDETEKEVKESAKNIIDEIDKRQAEMIKQILHAIKVKKLEVLEIEEQNVNNIQAVKLKLLEFTELLNDFSNNKLSDIDKTSMQELLTGRNDPADTLSTIKQGIFNENVDVCIEKVTYQELDIPNNLIQDYVGEIEKKTIYVHPGMMSNITLKHRWSIGHDITCISYSKDKDYLLASGRDNGKDIIKCFTGKGQMVWQNYSAEYISEHTIVTDGTEYLVAAKKHKLELYSLTDGTVLDTIKTPFVSGYWYEGCAVCAVGDKSFLVVNSGIRPNSLAKFEIRNGKMVDMNAAINTDLCGIGGLYYCSDRGEVYVTSWDENTIEAIDYTTHDIQWKITGECEGKVILPWGLTEDGRGNLYVADGVDKRILTIREGRVTSVLQIPDCPSTVFDVCCKQCYDDKNPQLFVSSHEDDEDINSIILVYQINY